MVVRVSSVVSRLLFLLAGTLAALLVAEGILRVYNPAFARVKGDRIILVTNKQYRIRNDVIPALDPVVTFSRNSLGFRGPDPPPDFDRYLSIITVGGSTTLCLFLSDDKTWSARLAAHLDRSIDRLWINNAGLDGHSTYGHLVLLEDYVRKLAPKVVVVLAGVNDLGRSAAGEFDTENVKSPVRFKSARAFAKSLAPYSEVVSLAINLYRSATAFRHGLVHQRIDFGRQRQEDVPPNAERDYLAQVTAPDLLSRYEERLRRIVAIARTDGIAVVLVTQPALAGAGVDDETGADLARIHVAPGRTGKMWWDALEAYNGVTRRVGREERTLVIDLASKMPKSSRYFYDFLHFTNAGAEMVATILSRDLCPFLRQTFPAFAHGQPCS